MTKILTCIAAFVFLLGLSEKSTGQELMIQGAQPVALRPLGNIVFDSSGNSIIDKSHSMYPFYRQLAELKGARINDGSRVVSVFHLGDSHVQAGFLTGRIMRLFHADFGNAGRGLITPLKMARTNEPSDYVIRSSSAWNTARCIQNGVTIPLGIGGVSILSRDSLFTISVGSMERDDQRNYLFNRVEILHYPTAPELDADQLGLDLKARHIENKNPYITTIRLNKLVSSLNLVGRVTKENRDSAIYYGFILENGKNGVLYHSAGINGTQFTHWTKIPSLGEQTRALDPALVILSLGTNESFMGKSFNLKAFNTQMDTIVSRIKAKNPGAAILFTTPPENCIRSRVNGATTYVKNPLVPIISRAIVKYATDHHYAYWDLFSISGGEGSCLKVWQKNGLFAKDYVHFTVDGYNVIGDYLYRAIIKGYNDYVTHNNG